MTKQFGIFDSERYAHYMTYVERKSIVQSFVIALDVIKEADRSKTIRNADLSVVKSDVSRFISTAYKAFRETIDRKAVQEISIKIGSFYYLSSLVEVRSCHKKLTSKKYAFLAEHEGLSAAYKSVSDFIAAFAELCSYLLDAKNILTVTKREKRIESASGRAALQLQNKNQVRGTCSCCFRDVAVTSLNGMARHNYKMLAGAQSASCKGVNFPAFELSDIGTKHRLSECKQALEKKERALSEADELNSVPFISGGRRAVFSIVCKGDRDFDKALRTHKAQLESDIMMLKSAIDMLEERVRNWKKGHLIGSSRAVSLLQ